MQHHASDLTFLEKMLCFLIKLITNLFNFADMFKILFLLCQMFQFRELFETNSSIPKINGILGNSIQLKCGYLKSGEKCEWFRNQTSLGLKSDIKSQERYRMSDTLTHKCNLFISNLSVVDDLQIFKCGNMSKQLILLMELSFCSELIEDSQPNDYKISIMRVFKEILINIIINFLIAILYGTVLYFLYYFVLFFQRKCRK